MNWEASRDSTSFSGRLHDRNLNEILKKARDRRLTGRISIKAREGFAGILMCEGKIVSATSPVIEEQLGERLVKKGIFTEAELTMVHEAQKKNPTKNLESTLVEEGYLKKEDLFLILNELSEDVLFGILFWDGVYRFEESVPPPIPEEFLIDVEGLLKRLRGSLDELTGIGEDDLLDLKFEADTASAPAPDKDPKEEIVKTLKDVAKSLATFKPRELVIVVEDEVLMRTILVDGLSHFDFKVETYDNARMALDRIRELETDRVSPVVILDLMMTGLYDDKDVYGGMDLLSYISQNHPVIPVIITTGAGDLQIRLQTTFLGASCFLNKPTATDSKGDVNGNRVDLFIEELAYCIENIFRRSQAYLEKEQLASVREELLNQLLKKGNVSFWSHDDILRSKILFVDDEEGIRNLGEEFLKNEGFGSVETRKDGQEGIDSFTAKRHDVVVTDIVMPKKNGIELLKYVKILSPNTQVVIITGNADKNSAVAAVKLGAFEYIEKPINFLELTQVVRRAAELKHVLDEHL
jgi:FixJ family two-component response regulator